MIAKQFTLVLFLALSISAIAQNPIRIMSYNVLNFPEPNPAGKEDTLASILAFHPVDLLLVQELRFESGVDLILNGALNVNGETRFSAATWVPMQSNPNSNHKLQQLLYYDHEKFILHEETFVLTERRDLNNYTLYLNDPDLAQTNDTTWLDIYVLHLKSSQGQTNEQIRDNMVDSLFQHIASKPADRNIIVAGDMNVYSSFEPAYQNLMDDGHSIVLKDPINMPGAWNNNSNFSEIHTQSTRTSSIFGDGASGGMDDRFDQVLLSESLMNGTEGVSFTDGTYEAFGQSGYCYNQNITDCSNSQIPQEILTSLYYMSDHLPVVLELETSISIGLEEFTQNVVLGAAYFSSANVLILPIENTGRQDARVVIYNALGQELKTTPMELNGGSELLEIQVGEHAKGLIFIYLETEGQRLVSKVFRP